MAHQGHTLTSACSRPFHSSSRDARGPDYTSPGYGHFSSSYSSIASDRWGGCSDTGHPGPVTGILIPDDTFCFMVYYYFNYGFSAVSLLCLYTLLVLFMGNWFAYSKAYGTV